ncbi:MAG: ribose 5-phosphate isomerase B [Thermoleophilia bacterium]
MKVVIAADHAGYNLKSRIIEHLQGGGDEVVDLGTDSTDSVDYPAFAIEVARAVASGQAERGILVCGTGLGMCITANKFAGIRAVGPGSTEQAEMSRRHNDANILCLGERTMEAGLALAILDTWMETPFDGGRHSERLEQITDLETIKELDQ